MLACMMDPQEILGLMYLQAQRSLQRTLTKQLQVVHDSPLSVWQAAAKLRSDAQADLCTRLSHMRNTYQPPPQWCLASSQVVTLHEGCTYTLTNDVRNGIPVIVTMGPEVSEIQPGQSLTISNTASVEVHSNKPAVIAWARIGGQYRTGNLRDCLPLPAQRKKETPPQTSVVRRWWWFW